MANLATQLDFEKFLQIDVTAEPDAAIAAYLEAASAIVESYCGRVFTSSTVTAEVHDGWTFTIWLRQPPVTSITTVVENTVTLAATDYLWYPDGRLIRLTAAVPPGPTWWYPTLQTVAVTYVGGYGTAAAGTIPHDVRDVVVRMAARSFQASAAFASVPAGSAGVRSVSLSDSDSVEYTESAQGGFATASVTRDVMLTPEDKWILDHYRIVNLV